MLWREQFLTERKPWFRKPRLEPVRYTDVRVSRPGDNRWTLPVMTDANGWAEVDLPPGEYDVECCGQRSRITHGGFDWQAQDDRDAAAARAMLPDLP
jgi:hypothetical protein